MKKLLAVLLAISALARPLYAEPGLPNGGGSGGGAATIANGADTAEGSTTDAPATVPTTASAATTIALLKALNNNQTPVQAPVAPGTATATKSVLFGCQFNATTVTFANGQQGQVSCGAQGDVFIEGNVASGAADSGNPVKVGGVFNNAPTASVGQRIDLQLSQAGGLIAASTVTSGDGKSNSAVQLNGNSAGSTPTSSGLLTYGFNFNGTTWDRQRGTAANGTFVSPGGFTYTHITTDATTVVKSGAGSLHTICVNTVGAGATITVDDAISATTPTIAVLSGATLGCYTYDVAFSVGLTIVTAVTAPDITVSWR